MASENVFKYMPKELAELILSELEPADLARASGVNLHWRKLASSDLLWRKFFNDTQNVKEPLKTVYGNRKVNWMNCRYKMSIMKHPHKTFYIARTFPNSNVLYTGSLSDMMEEWDLERAEKICEYEVPTGPASNYRMDETYCLIERESSLKRWRRHKESDSSGIDETFDWVYVNPSEEDGPWLKYFQAYQFVRERCVMATVADNGTMIIQLHDMDKNQCLWRHEIKVVDVPRPDPANPDYGYLARLEWDSLCMTYDIATIVYRNNVIVLDLNKHDVKYHMRDDVMGEETARHDFFSACAMHKDLLLASKTSQVHFYSLKDGELSFTVPLPMDESSRFNSTIGWAKLDGEKAVVCGTAKAFVIDTQKRCVTGTLEWSNYSRGWTQDVAMCDDFFAVLATDEVVVFDFRKRSKEQELKDAEELKRLQEAHKIFLEEERERQAKEAEENERRWEQYRLEHPEEFPEYAEEHNHEHHDEHEHDHNDDDHDHDSSSESSEEQPIIPPFPSNEAPALNNNEEKPGYRQPHAKPTFGRIPYGRGRGNWGSNASDAWRRESSDDEPRVTLEQFLLRRGSSDDEPRDDEERSDSDDPPDEEHGDTAEWQPEADD